LATGIDLQVVYNYVFIEIVDYKCLNWSTFMGFLDDSTRGSFYQFVKFMV